MRQFITRVVIPIALVVCILFSLPLVCGHGHAHNHDHAASHGHQHSHGEEEPAAYRWSKLANEQYQDAEEEEPPAHKWSQEANQQSSHPDTDEASKPEKSSIWFDAIVATLGISIAPYLILFVIPVTNSKEHEPYLKVLLAFASGGLLGDAFLHLIPHALMAQAASSGGHAHSHSHSHSHDGDGEAGHGHDVSIGLAVLGGIIAFLVVEKFVRIFKGGHMHSHSHSHTVSTDTNGGGKTENEKAKKGGEKVDEKAKKGGEKVDEKAKKGGEKVDEKAKKGGEKVDEKAKKGGEKVDEKAKKGDEKQKKVEKKKASKQDKKSQGGEIKVAGYLNLAADFTHNLTDGLAIGASFLAGKNVGVVTTLTIFLHEIPHEIGDFAILLQSGCSRRKAMALQLVTAVGALAGTLISLMAEGADESAIAWILPFTAGGFIYIATVSVIPELLENTSFWQSVFEVVALLSGVALMMGIAHLEEMEHGH